MRAELESIRQFLMSTSCAAPAVCVHVCVMHAQCNTIHTHKSSRVSKNYTD